MDLWQLYIFIKVVELKSFSKAGKAVHLSQPTISSHIKDLEEYLNCRLIDRLGKEAVPTRAGELLFSYARKLVALRDETEAAMAEFLGAVKGRLKIGGSTIPGGYILPEIIGGFTREFSDVRISLKIASTDEIIGYVLGGELELGLVGAKTGDKRIWQKKIIEDELCLIAAPGHKWASIEEISAESLKNEPFISREHGSGTMKTFMEYLHDKGLTRDDFYIIAEMGSTEAIKAAVKSGLGISIISRIAATGDIDSGKLAAINISGIKMSRSFYLTGHSERTASPVCRAFIKFMDERFNC